MECYFKKEHLRTTEKKKKSVLWNQKHERRHAELGGGVEDQPEEKSPRKENKETDPRKTQELQGQTRRGRKREGERQRNRENGDDYLLLKIT